MDALTNTAEIESWKSVGQFDDHTDNVGDCVLVKVKQIEIFGLSDKRKVYDIDNHAPHSYGNE